METNTEQQTHDIKQECKRIVREIRTKLKPSRLFTWRWSQPGFEGSLEWLLSHPRRIHHGEYLSDTPGKEVWRVQLPESLGGHSIIYKFYDLKQKPLGERVGWSAAYREALNFETLKTLGIPVSEVLACGERRQFSLLQEAFIISVCILDSFDGSSLAPTGNLADHKELRHAFCLKCLEQIALAHRHGCFHSAFRAHKILCDEHSSPDDLQLTWVDVANCQIPSPIPMKSAIPQDLVHMFVDLRLDADEIHKLCAHYLLFNPDCDYDADTLWDAMTKLKR